MLPDLKEFIENTGGKILFVGIGNVLKSDDGVGVYISDRIRNTDKIMSLSAEVSIENYIGKINSIDPDSVIIVDCVEMASLPGVYRLMKPEKIHDNTFNTHNISIKKLADFFKMPVFVLGIQPENIEFGENISYIVREVADKIIQTINTQEVQYGY